MSDPNQPPPPDQILMQLLFGKFLSRALSTVANLAIADHIGDGPTAVTELASKCGANDDALYRALRCLAAVGVFKEEADRKFSNNEVSKLLVSGEGSMRAMVRWINTKPAWDAWGRLDYSVETGKPAFNEVYGTSIFDHFKKDTETAAIFHDAMTGFSGMTAQAVAKTYDFSSSKQVVDIGGGHGALLAAIVSEHAHVKGVVFDLPEVVEGAPATISKLPAEVAANIELKAGSFFDGVPTGADTYIMKHIIHDWSDEQCVTILKHCREGLADGGKILVVDTVVTDAPEAAFSKIVDLEMLVMTDGGRERTEAEFAALFEKAGLKLNRVVPTESPVCVVEAVKA